MYTAFARVYDALMDQVDYGAWARHYQALMEKYGVPRGGRCVECACGTGSITLPLKKAGYQMTGWIFPRICWKGPWSVPAARG